MSNFIHPSAIVDEGAKIGAGSKIWHFCHVMPNAVIGKNCILGQNVFVANDVTLGDGVKVQNNVSIYTGVHCEDHVFLGPSMVFTNVLNPRSNIERKEEFKKTLVKVGASIGANATVICGNTIGAYSLIGAGAVVTKDVPDYAMILGIPGEIKGWVSKRGIRLEFDENGNARCSEDGSQYQMVNGECLEVGNAKSEVEN